MTTAWAHLPNAHHIDRILAHLPNAHHIDRILAHLPNAHHIDRILAHLPNAHHIDRILAHLRAHPQAWADAHSGYTPERDAAWAAAWAAAWDAARGAARGAARDAARGAALVAARGAALVAARGAAWGAIAALLAWDDCAPLLDLPEGALRVMSAAGHHPATLMLPAVIALSDTSNR